MEVQSKLSAQLPKYRAHWACSDEKKGYSGEGKGAFAPFFAPSSLPLPSLHSYRVE